MPPAFNLFAIKAQFVSQRTLSTESVSHQPHATNMLDNVVTTQTYETSLAIARDTLVQALAQNKKVLVSIPMQQGPTLFAHEAANIVLTTLAKWIVARTVYSVANTRTLDHSNTTERGSIVLETIARKFSSGNYIGAASVLMDHAMFEKNGRIYIDLIKQANQTCSDTIYISQHAFSISKHGTPISSILTNSDHVDTVAKLVTDCWHYGFFGSTYMALLRARQLQRLSKKIGDALS